MMAVAQRAVAAARPKVIYDVLFIEGRDGDSLTFGGQRFVSRVLFANLEKVERVFPYIATCGDELEQLGIPATDFMGQFCVDTVKELALGAAMQHLTAHLEKAYGLTKLATMNPGSGDAIVWPIEQQRELFALFGDTRKLIGVTLLDTFLMLPNKTVSGLFYPSEVDFKTCQLCHREQCPHRRAAFDKHLWEVMNP
jgi:hypothetical protein